MVHVDYSRLNEQYLFGDVHPQEVPQWRLFSLELNTPLIIFNILDTYTVD